MKTRQYYCTKSGIHCWHKYDVIGLLFQCMAETSDHNNTEVAEGLTRWSPQLLLKPVQTSSFMSISTMVNGVTCLQEKEEDNKFHF